MAQRDIRNFKFLKEALIYKHRYPKQEYFPYQGQKPIPFDPTIYKMAYNTFVQLGLKDYLNIQDPQVLENFYKNVERDPRLKFLSNPEAVINDPTYQLSDKYYQEIAQNPIVNQVFTERGIAAITTTPPIPSIHIPSTGEPTRFQAPRIPIGISSIGKTVGVKTSIALRSGGGRVTRGLGSILGGIARGGGRLLIGAGGFGADALVGASNRISAGGLISGPPKRVWIGALIGFFILFFILTSVTNQPFSAPTGEAAPIPGSVGIGSTAPNVSVATPVSKLNCSASMSAEDINNFFAGKNGYINFQGTGQIFAAAAAQAYKINPALVIAIGIQESNLGMVYKGRDAENSKNAFGLMQANSLMRFNSWAEGAEVAFKTITNYNCSTIECIGQKYAPIGASNDPKNSNKDWVPGVVSIFNSIPQSSCTPSAVAEIKLDRPSGWPTTGKITEGPFEGFSHQKPPQNAIDISNSTKTPVYSTLSGIVSQIFYIDPSPGIDYGVRVIITNKQTGAEVLFAHLIPQSNAHLKQGQAVSKGDLIGLIDSTGHSTGNHLHYEIRGSIKNESFGQFVPGGIYANGIAIKQVGNPGEWPAKQ